MRKVFQILSICGALTMLSGCVTNTNKKAIENRADDTPVYTKSGALKEIGLEKRNTQNMHPVADVDTWNTYQNDVFNIKLKYPPNLEIQEVYLPNSGVLGAHQASNIELYPPSELLVQNSPLFLIGFSWYENNGYDLDSHIMIDSPVIYDIRAFSKRKIIIDLRGDSLLINISAYSVYNVEYPIEEVADTILDTLMAK